MTPTLLAIGTTHPLNVAGIGLDLRIAGQLGVQLISIVAGVSAQSAATVVARAPVGDDLIHAQFDALRDIRIDAVHIGALVDARCVGTIARRVAKFGAVPVVCDPVIAATGGDRLADDATVEALRTNLFAHCALVMPNLDEASQLLGRTIGSLVEMEAAAVALLQTGARAVLLKGGHFAPSSDTVTDVLATDTAVRRFAHARREGSLRGTGDLLACMTAARLAHGDELVTAVEAGRTFVQTCFDQRVTFAGMQTIR